MLDRIHAVLSPFVIVMLALLCAAAGVTRAADFANPGLHARVVRILKATPLIVGHNDLPWEIRERFKSELSAVDLESDTSKLPFPPDGAALMTDIPRLRTGMVGGQFWSVWVPVEVKGYAAVQTTLEQIDLVKRIVARYPNDLEMAYTAADVRRIHQHGKVASMIGIEGGHQINDSLSVLRQKSACSSHGWGCGRACFIDRPPDDRR